MNPIIMFTLYAIGKCLLLTVVLLLMLAVLLYVDRKTWAAVQLRRGPNVVGPFGLLQAFADFLKFICKEAVLPSSADKALFLLAPVLTFTLALASWAVIPWSETLIPADLNVGVLYLFAISSLGVYGIIIGGWASNSKYPFLGALRSAAQMISYEVSLGLIIVNVLLLSNSMRLSDIVLAQAGHGLFSWYIWPLLPMAIMFFISGLAETNRPPFDLPEAESELVAGYQSEYSAVPFLLFMIGEYLNMTLICAMTTVLFLGGWLSPLPYAPFTSVPGPIWFFLKIFALFFIFALVKAVVPRYRYDQLMRLGWKVFLPTSLLYTVGTAAYVTFLRGM